MIMSEPPLILTRMGVAADAGAAPSSVVAAAAAATTRPAARRRGRVMVCDMMVPSVRCGVCFTRLPGCRRDVLVHTPTPGFGRFERCSAACTPPPVDPGA